MSDPSQNRVTEYRYNGDGQLTQLIARNAATGVQETEWIYGTTLSESGVASSLLVRAKTYPGSSASTDRVEFKYNRLGQVTEIKDQAGTVHVGEYDARGRLLHDRATALGSGIDGTVRRLSASYNVRGLLDHVTSHSSATVGAGSVVNDVKLTYNDFNQLLAEAQAHDGAVGSGSSQVAYSYADGSNLTARRTGVTYPNGRSIATGYGTGGSLDDLNNRITSFDEWGTSIATYLRRGINSTVKVEYVEPEVELTYIKQSGEPNGDGGDQYTGLDRFNRIVDIRWLQGSAHTAVDRYQYGFDRASNRRYRHNATGSDWDEYYTYDGLSQLRDLQRGTLNGTNTGISGTPSWEEGFSFDPTGNWSNYLTKVGGSTTLSQDRTHNPVNEIATIASSAATVGYDPAGNMTTMPKVGDWSTAQTLKWDAWNRLVEIREGGTLISQYRYDGMFRRVSKASAEDTYLGNTWQTRHYYYSDRWQVLEERLDTEASAARQFIWGARYRDDLILRDRYDDPSPSGSSEEPHDGRLYVTHDQWHVTGVLQPNGTVFERYAYDAFGKSIVLGPDYSIRDESICSWETRYGAYRFDSESNLYQVRFRYLHSELGRWLSRDPMDDPELLPSGTNFYSYVSNSSQNLTDPFGLCPPDKVADDAGRCCCKNEMKTIKKYQILPGTRGHLVGHEFIYCPTLGSRGKYPAKGFPKNFYGPGIIKNDDDTLEAMKKNLPDRIQHEDFKACPESVNKIKNRLVHDENHPTNYFLFGSQCARFADDVLEDAGFKPAKAGLITVPGSGGQPAPSGTMFSFPF